MPVHGYKIGENYWGGQMVKYTCDPGYFLEGPTNRMCLENGNWSDVVPKCNEMESSFIAYSLLIYYLFYLNIQKLIIENLLIRGGSRGRVQGVRSPPPEMTHGFLIQLVFCKKKKLCGLLVLE